MTGLTEAQLRELVGRVRRLVGGPTTGRLHRLGLAESVCLVVFLLRENVTQAVAAADELARLGLGPGMHLKVVPVSETEPVRPARCSVRGILAGAAAVPSWADFEQASQTAIADVEARYGPGGRWAADNR